MVWSLHTKSIHLFESKTVYATAQRSKYFCAVNSEYALIQITPNSYYLCPNNWTIEQVCHAVFAIKQYKNRQSKFWAKSDWLINKYWPPSNPIDLSVTWLHMRSITHTFQLFLIHLKGISRSRITLAIQRVGITYINLQIHIKRNIWVNMHYIFLKLKFNSYFIVIVIWNAGYTLVGNIDNRKRLRVHELYFM